MVLVTGHKGYIGSHLIKRFDNAIGLDIKEGNDLLDCYLPEADVVIHLAAVSGVIESMQNPVRTVENNILATVRLAEKYKNTKFIFASTGGAIQDEIISPYGLSKYCCEEFIKLLFNDYVILRFANVYGGEGSRSVIGKFIREDVLTVYGDGSQTRTFVHIEDLLDGIVSSMGWKKGSYYFGSDDNYTIRELAEATGKPIQYAERREGELIHSSLNNTTPDWKPTRKVMDYIQWMKKA